jgi:formiminoglutamase
MLVDTDMSIWSGRSDLLEGAAGRRWHDVVRPLSRAARGGVAIIGFACDAGVRRNGGRAGAAHGPSATRAMLANMPAWPDLSIFEAGDIVCDGDQLERAQDELATRVEQTLESGLFPVVLGGGHEVAYGSFSGLARFLEHRAGRPRIGIVNIDAHFDLRLDERPSSGTPFRQILEGSVERDWPVRYACFGVSRFANTQALFDRALSHDVLVTLDEEMGPHQLPNVRRRLSQFLAEVDHVYLSVDLDVLPPGSAPGVSAPATRGVDFGVVEEIIDAVATTGKLRLADLAELNPLFDVDDRTARLAARLAARIALMAGGGGAPP